MRVDLEQSEIKRLLVYLEHLAVNTDSLLKTRIIREDVLQLMKNIQKQTGLSLDPQEMPTTEKVAVVDENCAHLYSAKGICQICGQPGSG